MNPLRRIFRRRLMPKSRIAPMPPGNTPGKLFWLNHVAPLHARLNGVPRSRRRRRWFA